MYLVLNGSWFLFFKSTSAYDVRIIDGSSDLCSSDLCGRAASRPGRSRLRPLVRSLFRRKDCAAGRSEQRHVRILPRTSRHYPAPDCREWLYPRRRSAQRRDGKEGGSQGQFRWPATLLKTTKTIIKYAEDTKSK